MFNLSKREVLEIVLVQDPKIDERDPRSPLHGDFPAGGSMTEAVADGVSPAAAG